MQPILYNTTKIGDALIDSFSFGEGEKNIVVIPGMSLTSIIGSAEAIASAYADFGREYTLTVFDYRRNMPKGFTTVQMADDIARATDALGIGSAFVFSTSQGGMIAEHLAARYPQKVAKLVLASTYDAPGDLARETFPRWRALAEAGDPVPLNRDFTACCYAKETLAAFRDVFAATEGVGSPEDLRRFAVLCDADLSHDARDVLGSIACPTLVVGSSGDETLGVEGSYALAEAIPDAKLVILDGYGHAVYDEHPGYKAILLDFFGVGAS